MPDIFISYSRDDQATARRFAEAFEREGFSVWWDQTLNPGDAYDHVTEKALREAKAVAVLWSKKSVDSRWVRAEATLANRNRTLLPVMIEPCERPIMFELTHTVDLSHWTGDPKDKEWQTYVAGVRRFLQKDAPTTPSIPVSRPTAARTNKITPIAITIAVAALVIAGIAWWALNRAPGSGAKQATAVATNEVTLAVLPFLNLSSDPEQEYFSDGLSEEILNQVAQIEGLKVAARTSSFAFKGKTGDMRLIGEKLGVANLLEGSIRKDGNDLRITAQLINAKDDTHIWSHTYAREMNKILVVQEEIARDVAKALSIKLDVGEMSRAKGGTTNLEAYDKLLRALAANQKGDFKKGYQFQHEATDLDPGFLNAWIGQFAALQFVGLTLEESQKERARILERLEAVAPGSWQALFVRASMGDFSGQWLKMKDEYDAATAAAKTAKSKTGWNMIAPYDARRRSKVGDLTGTQRLFEQLANGEPSKFFGTSRQWMRALFAIGLNAEGLAEMDQLKTLQGYLLGSNPELIFELIMELRFRKNVDPATIWAHYAKIGRPIPLLSEMFARRDDPKAARLVLQQAFDKPAGPQRVASEVITLWADFFGDKDLALAAMRRGNSKTTFDQFSLTSLWLPYATGLRSDPRFKEIVRERGMVDYWRASGEWGDFCKPMGTDDFECH